MGQSSGGCSTINARNFSMSDTTAAVAWSSIAPIERQNLAAHCSEAGTAAADATLCGFDQRLAETGVHRLREQPGAAVAHSHPPPGGGY